MRRTTQMNPTPENETPLTDAAEKQSIAAFIEEMGVDAIFPTDGYDFARELERDRKRLREALNQCDSAFSKFCPDESSRYGMAWDVIRTALSASRALDAKLKNEAGE